MIRILQGFKRRLFIIKQGTPGLETETVISISIYFLLMLGIGVYAWRVSERSAAGYLLGGRQLSPAVTALSAGASDMSAWILMGLPGAMFMSGFSSSWIAVGLLIGAFLNYLLVAPRLRVYTELSSDAITLPDYFEKRFEDQSRALRVLSSLVIIIFFTLYTSSGIVAGGVLFQNSFGLGYATGIWVTAGVVVAYTFLGGFRAVCTTDFVQGCLMLLALVVVPWVAFTHVGGVDPVRANVAQVDPAHLNMFTGVAAMTIISNMAWGLGYFGQPHIIVRFMAIRSFREINLARRIGMGWMTVSILGALMTGLIGLAYMVEFDISLADPETVFIVLAQLLFHPLLGGFLLAGILAAIMSTISSQLLVSSSSLSKDFYKAFIRPRAGEREVVLVSRLAVLLVALCAISLAADRDATILALVSHAWAGFGASFGPLVLMSLFWRDMNRAGALAGMIVGAVTVLVWVYGPFTINGQAPGDFLYEIVPGFVLSAAAIWIVSKLTRGAGNTVKDGFTAMEQVLR